MGATAANISPAHVAAFRASAQLCATKMNVENPQLFNLMMRLPEECANYLTDSRADVGVKIPVGITYDQASNQISPPNIAYIPQVSSANSRA